MEFDIEDLARRLVVGRKRDGRGIYDPSAKQELVEICRRPGASVAKLARECGINANLVATWLRKREAILADVVDVGTDPVASAFIAVPMVSYSRSSLSYFIVDQQGLISLGSSSSLAMMLLKWRMTSPNMWFNSSIESIGGIMSTVPQIFGSHCLGCSVVGPTAMACMNPSMMSDIMTSSVSTS